MTRRDRHIRILQRLKHPYGALGWEVGTDKEIEDLVRSALWGRGLARHNYRVLTRAASHVANHVANQVPMLSC